MFTSIGIRAAITLTLATLFPLISNAQSNSNENKSLSGNSFTSMGSERSGNKEGTIPEYTGQSIKINGIDPNEPGRRPDPFSNEKPILTITAQNANQYADKLDAQIDLFRKYPNYRMQIYPSHRSVTLPKYILDNTAKNAASCKTTADELGLTGCYAGIPFPAPKTGNQVMWNHLTAYEFHTAKMNNTSFIVSPKGELLTTNTISGVQSWPVYDPKRTTPMSGSDIYWRVRADSVAPTRKVGEKLVVIDAVDSVGIGRRAYQYIAGQRRVKLAPNLAYDTPGTTTGGAQTMDDSKIFLGALDRFNFKLVGKKEKFIPYNAFRTTDHTTCPADKLATANFPNPDCMRYELHRVWIVEATLKPEYRHAYQKRRFYFDEDGFGAGTSEAYDASGKLWRLNEMIPYPLPEGGTSLTTWFGYDLQTTVWTAQGWTGYPGGGNWAIAALPETFFSPDALAGEGVR